MSGAGGPRILVISPNWIGDAVMAQPLLQCLRRLQPDAPIDVLATPVVAPVWRAMREVDTVLEASFRHGTLQLRERLAMARQLRQRGYGAAYVLPNTLKFALIPWLAGIARRVGYRGEMRYGLLNVMHHDDPQAPRAMVPFYAALAFPPGPAQALRDAIPRPRLGMLPEQQADALARAGLDAGRPLLVFAPGAEFGSAKRWPVKHYAQLASLALDAHPGLQLALLGSGKDAAVCAEIVGLEPRVRSLAGATSLADALALIAACAVLVSNDSGLLHAASALNRPVIALYGPTSPTYAPPFSDVAHSVSLLLDCAPCRQRECPLGHHRCMEDMRPEMVWAPMQAMLAQQG